MNRNSPRPRPGEVAKCIDLWQPQVVLFCAGVESLSLVPAQMRRRAGQSRPGCGSFSAVGDGVRPP